ncbi:MAG: hypothetical protein VX278_00750 [Myxococcota bacterium]|nr:hypothetical protein [Myxococcota bacterium]
MMLWLLSLTWASPWNPHEGGEADVLLELHDQEKWIELMPKARRYVKSNAKSFVGHLTLGRSLWLGHGEHARAMHHLKEAKKIYVSQWSFREEPPWRLYSQILFSLQSIAGDMGENELELQLIADYNRAQDEFEMQFDSSYAKLVGERGWPLMKLERYDEARSAAHAAIETGRIWQESLGYNVLCAVEAEEGNRQAAADNCFNALEHGRETGSGIAIDASNASNSSFAILDFDRAEEFAIEGTAAGGTTAPAWMNLLDLYILEGRGEAALEAMLGLRQSQLADPPHLRSQRRADIEVSFATILLLAGEAEAAMKAINRAILVPDRRGTISTTEEQTRGSHMALRYMIRKMKAEREKEKVAARGILERTKTWFSHRAPDPGLISDASAVRGALSDESRLIYTFRIYQDRGLVDVLPCIMGDLVEILGPGVSAVALEEVRAIDTFLGMEAYYDALSAEIAYQRDDASQVIQYATKAKDNLPLAEAILTGRMHALLGWAYVHQGDETVAVNHYAEAYRQDPSIFRRLGLSIPIMIEVDSGALSSEIAAALQRSPRFHSSHFGFIVQVSGGDVPRVCMSTPLGAQLNCATSPPRTKTVLVEEEGKDPIEKEVRLDDQEYLFEIVDNIHLLFFGLSFGSSGVDWKSLDGSTTTSRHATRKQLKKLLDD